MSPGGNDNPNGYTRIPNAMIVPTTTNSLTGLELRVLLSIIRESLGWNQDAVEFCVSERARAFHCSRSALSRAVHKLIERRILKQTEKPGNHGSRISLLELDLVSVAERAHCSEVRMSHKNGNSVTEKAHPSNQKNIEGKDSTQCDKKGTLDNGLRDAVRAARSVLMIGRRYREFSDEALEAYCTALQDSATPAERLLAALRLAPRRFKFWPTPLEIIELAGEVRDQTTSKSKKPENEQDWADPAEVAECFSKLGLGEFRRKA